MPILAQDCCYPSLIITTTAPEGSNLLIKLMPSVHSADSSGLFIEGYICVIGFLKKTKVFLIILLSLVTLHITHCCGFFVSGLFALSDYGSAMMQRERRSASEAERTPSVRRPSTVQTSLGMDLR